MRVRFVGVLDNTEQIIAEPSPPPCNGVIPPTGDNSRFLRIRDLIPRKRVACHFRVQCMLIHPDGADPTVGRYRAGRVRRCIMDALCLIQRQTGDNVRRFRSLNVRARFGISARLFEDTARGRATTATCAAAATVGFNVYELRSGHTYKMQTRLAKNKIREQMAKQTGKRRKI